MYQNVFHIMNMHGWDKLLERLLDHDAYLKMTDNCGTNEKLDMYVCMYMYIYIWMNIF